MIAWRYDSKVDLPTKLCLALSVFVVFSNYYYLYFFSFDQGVSGSPGYYSFLKIVGLGLFSIAVFKGKVRRFLPARHFVFLVFFCFSLIVFLAKRTVVDVGSDLYFNMIFCALPFVFLRVSPDLKVVLHFFEMCLWLLLLQIGVDIGIAASGLSLWDNKAFVGGLGNPSSFGIFCSVVLAYVLFLRKFSLISVVSFIVIFVGILGTKSLFSILAFILVVSYFVWCRSKLVWVGLFVMSGLALAIFWQWIISGHLGYKISSLMRLLFEGGIEGSRSITLRVNIHEFFLEKISEDFIGVMLFGYDEFYYYSADSQFLSFFGSFGVLLSLVFFGVVFFSLFLLSRNDDVSRFYRISIFLFFVMFFFNRVVDYYPIPLLFFLLIYSSSNKYQFCK